MRVLLKDALEPIRWQRQGLDIQRETETYLGAND